MPGDQHGYEVAAIRERDLRVAPTGVFVEADDAHWHNGANWQQNGQVATCGLSTGLAQLDRVAPVEPQQLAQFQPEAQIEVGCDS